MTRSKVFIILMLYVYPIIYGVALLHITGRLFGQFFYSLFRYTQARSVVMMIVTVVNSLIVNLEYAFIMLLMVFLESIRISAINAKILGLIETLILFIYLWSPEIVLVYIAILYILNRIANELIPKGLAVSIHTSLMCNSIIQSAYNSCYKGCMLAGLGISILLHVLYSYFIPLNIVTILIYLLIMMAVTIKIQRTRESIIYAIPPFGILIAITWIYATAVIGIREETYIYRAAHEHGK